MHPFLSRPPVTFLKTVSETDVYLFAGIAGDFSPNQVNEQAMRKTAYCSHIAYGDLHAHRY